jgi:hypothetical protein
MKSLFSAYGTSAMTILPLYTEGTENVSWVKGIDSQTGSGFGTSANTYTEGGSYITLKIVNEPTETITSQLATVTDSTVDLTGYKRACVDWEVIDASAFALIVSTEKDGDFDEFDAKDTFGSVTGRRIKKIPINGLTGNYYIRINTRETTGFPNTETAEIRIHRIWLEK